MVKKKNKVYYTVYESLMIEQANKTLTLYGDKWEEFREQIKWVNKSFLPTKIEKYDNGFIIYY